MQDKLPVLIVYAVLGIALGLWPVLALFLPRGGVSGPKSRPPWLAGAVTAISFAAIAVQGVQISAMAIVVLLGWFFMSGRGEAKVPRLAGCAAGLAIIPVLIWWRRGTGIHVDLSWAETLAAAALALIGLWVFSRRSVNATEQDGDVKQPGNLIAFAIFGFATIYLAFSTGIYVNTEVLLTAWHHWGAYVGPAEQLWSGARVFHDIPLQYGLGPSASIAALCSANCWTGMYALSGLTTVAMCGFVGVLAFNLAARAHFTTPARWLVLAVVILSCYFWTSYPPSTSSPVVTPSTSGLRFLPTLMFAAFLMWRYPKAANGNYLAGHIAWGAACLWSPESSFYVTFVWWPFYLWARCSAAARAEIWMVAIRAVGVLLCAMAALVALFNAVYWLVYGVLPDFYAYWAYAIDPPGVLPINPVGSIWYFGAVLAVGVIALFRVFSVHGDSPAFRGLFLPLLAAYAVLSYFLGRSHDNNVLNLMPFIVLVLVAAAAAPLPPMWSSMTTTLLVAVLAWTCTFGWTAWGDAFRQGRGFEFAPNRIVESFSYQKTETVWRILARYNGYHVKVGDPADAARAVSFIEKTYGEPVTVLDSSMDLIVTPHPRVWSALHDIANFSGISSDKRRAFLAAAVKTSGKRGWLVVDKLFPAEPWIADFEQAYDRGESRDFGSYYAIRFTPKTSGR